MYGEKSDISYARRQNSRRYYRGGYINNTFVPNGCAVDLAGEGKRYDEHIAELGGIDLQLLGIGLDVHIGFNEPDKYFVKSTHVVDLHESTIMANSRFFQVKTKC